MTPLKTQFFIEFYNYATEKGYFFLKKREHSYQRNIIICKEPTINENKDLIYSYIKLNLLDWKKRIESQNTMFFNFKEEQDKDVLNTFTKDFLTNLNHEDKVYFIKNIKNFLNYQWKESFIQLLDAFETKDLIKYLQLFPISILDINSVKLNEINDYLENKGIEEEAIDTFLLKYLKNRSKQISNTNVGPKVKDFLITKYKGKEDKLKPYTKFFNYVKEIYEDINIEFELVETYSSFVRVDCQKLSNLICIPNYSAPSIHSDLSCLMYAMKEVYNFENIDIDEFKKSKKITEITVYSNTLFSRE